QLAVAGNMHRGNLVILVVIVGIGNPLGIGIGFLETIRIVGVAVGFLEWTKVHRYGFNLIQVGVGVGFRQRKNIRCGFGMRNTFSIKTRLLAIAGQLILFVDVVIDYLYRVRAARVRVDRRLQQTISPVICEGGLFLLRVCDGN